MTNAVAFKKGIAALCCALGVFLFLGAAYYLWSAPIQHAMEATIMIVAGFILHTIFWILWR